MFDLSLPPGIKGLIDWFLYDPTFLPKYISEKTLETNMQQRLQLSIMNTQKIGKSTETHSHNIVEVLPSSVFTC